MKQTISKSDKTFKILNKLIVNGFYKGNIGADRFELVRKNRSPKNHRLIGILNDENKFELKYDYKYPMNIAAKVALGLGILISIISLINESWLLTIILITLGLLIWVDFKMKEKKEIDLFTSKFLEFDKREYY